MQILQSIHWGFHRTSSAAVLSKNISSSCWQKTFVCRCSCVLLWCGLWSTSCFGGTSNKIPCSAWSERDHNHSQCASSPGARQWEAPNEAFAYCWVLSCHCQVTLIYSFFVPPMVTFTTTRLGDIERCPDSKQNLQRGPSEMSTQHPKRRLQNSIKLKQRDTRRLLVNKEWRSWLIRKIE